MEKWQKVILEWVTVLTPGQFISGYSSLLDGILLVNVLEKLSSEDASIVIDRSNPQESIHQFVKTHYPNYVLSVEPTHVTDLEEVTYLSSLIIHYCSISTETFREQASKLLSSQAQRYLVAFLTELITEEGILVSSKVTRNLIQKAILNACRDTPKTRPNESTSNFSTPRRKDNLFRNQIRRTLNEFINSPEGRRQLQMEQLARENRDLKAKLAAETDQKFDLLEEIKLRDNKLERLTKDYDDRGKKMSKLESELFTMESQAEVRKSSPQRNQSMLQLKAELKTTKQQLQSAVINLENSEKEKNSIVYKLNVSESELRTYKEKVIESESRSIELESLVQTQSNQISGLHEELKELREILNEYKANRMNQSVDSLGPDQPETLGAVIELQLHEKEAEKRQVESKLDELSKEFHQLQDYVDNQKLEMVKVKCELREKDDQLKDAYCEIKCFKVALDKTNKEFKILQATNLNLHEQLETARHEYDEQLKKRDEIIGEYKAKQHGYEEKICEQSMIVSSKERALDEIKHQVKELHLEITNLNQQLTDCTMEISMYENQIKKMTETISKNQIEIEAVNSELETVKASESSKNQELEVLKQKLAQEQSTTFDLLVEKEQLTQKLEEIQAENNSKDQTIKEIRKQVSVLQNDLLKLNSQQSSELESNVCNTDEQVQLVHEMDCLQKLLQDHIKKGIRVIEEREDLKEFLQKTIEANEREITEQFATITKQEEKIKELVKENQQLTSKANGLSEFLDRQSEILETIKDERQQLQQALNQLKNDYLHIETDLKNSQCSKLVLEQEKDSITNQLEQQMIAWNELNFEMEQIKREHQNQVKNLENALVEKDQTIVDLQTKYRQQLELTENQLQIISALNSDLQTKTNVINVLEDEKHKLEEKLKNIKLNISHLESNVVKYKTEIGSKKEQIVALQQEIEGLTEHHKLVLNEKDREFVSMKDEIILKYEGDINEKNEDILKLKHELQVCLEKINCLNKSLEDNEVRINVLSEEKVGLETQCALLLESQKEHYDLVRKYTSICEEYQAVNNDMVEYRATIERLELIIEEFKQSTLSNQEANVALMRDYEEKIKSLTEERDQVELKLKESNESLEALKETCDKHEQQRDTDQKTLQKLYANRDSLMKKIEDLESIQNQLNTDILICKKQIMVAEENFMDRAKEHKLHVESYEEKLQRLNMELDEKVKLSEDTRRAYENLKTVSQEKYAELEEKLNEKDQEINNLHDQIKELNDSINQLENDKCILVEEAKKLEKTMHDEALQKQQDYDILVSDYKKMEQIRSSIENTKAQLETELKDVKDALDKSEIHKSEIIEEYKTEISQLIEIREDTYKQLRDEIQTTNEQLEKLREENQTIVAQLELLELEKLQLRGEIERNEHTVERLEQERDDFFKKDAETRQELVEKTEHLREHLTQTTDSLAQEKEAQAKLLLVVQKEERARKNLENQLVETTEELNITKQKVSDLRKCNADYDSQLEKMHYEKSALSLELLELKSNLENQKFELGNELKHLRENHEKVLQEHDHFQKEILSLKSSLADHEEKLQEAKKIEENYKAASIENNKLKEIISQSQQSQTHNQEAIDEYKKKIRDTRLEYDTRLEKIKDKFKAMYREELEKFETKSRQEKEKIIKQYTDQIRKSEEINQSLQSQVWEARNLYLAEKQSRETLQQRFERGGFGDVSSQESFPRAGRETELFQGKSAPLDSLFARNSNMHGSSMSLDGRPSIKQEPESYFVSLPRDTASKKTNKVYPENFKEPITKQVVKHQHPNVEIGAGLRMEDEEEEMWNGPYLNDLKSGTGQNNTKNRMSELQKRNTLCLPHLKSSYPVETQFLTPNKCREDDVKFGQTLDDSLKACLLPEEKQPKRNKDRTTTSYKKPGPPTPSKNGGRVSISSSDTSHVLREQYPNNTSVAQAVSRKPSTPSRIRSFFTSSRNSSSLGNGAGENTENHAVTPTRRRLSIFRKN